ncbi:hypothetical protein M1384_03770 [Candidatus Parvarchaeota archaeon]|jgi:hypothetical protein|nr:hypothetical protein [Candidatus Parvarchaeota archaeon]
MKIEMLLGAMKNIETANNGNPYGVITNIYNAKDNGIDILVGPEWSLTSKSGIYSRKLITKNKAKDAIKLLFNVSDYNEYAPRDARKILEEKIDDESVFEEVPDIPYSKREYERVLKDLKIASKGSDMLIFPGTAMFYDKNMTLYNVMPILRNGKVIKSIYKFNDGLSSRFNLRGALRLYPSETNYEEYKKEEYSLSYSKNPIINFNGIKTSVEICADAGILKRYGITNLDLQILSSCGNSSTDNAITRKGYVVAVDGFRDVNIRVSGKGLFKQRPIEKSEDMYLFNLEFEL